MTDNTRSSRREFLHTTAVGAGMALAAAVEGAARVPRGPNDTIQIGIVGPGGRGTGLMKECIELGREQNARVTAVCDIWNRRRDEAEACVRQAYGSAPKVYRRYEDLLADRDVDGIIIATADHQHARMLEMCVAAGKDAYCEKPMANVLEEANRTFDAVKRSGRVVQLGTQRRSFAKYRQAAQLIQQGVIGDLVKVDLIDNAYSPYRWARKPEDIASIQERDTDWNAFLMDKPKRPFDARIYRSFRLFREFSSGIIDQWMTHAIDTMHFLAGQDLPNSAVAHGAIYRYHDYRDNPDTLDVALDYGKGDRRFLVTYACSLLTGVGATNRFCGTRGTMEVEYNWKISGEGSEAADKLRETREITDAPNAVHHMVNWLQCVRKRTPSETYCPAEAGYGHSVACILAADAYWNGRRMVFDRERRAIVPG
jgi:predicted dehydrogenase